MIRRKKLLLIMLFVAVLATAVVLGRQAFIIFSIYRLNLSPGPAVGLMPAPKAGEKVLIFAPHPDDETLGAGGYIQQAVRAGAKVKVVLMTNGEYPELAVVLFEETLRLRPEAFIRLGYMRQQESLAALEYMGVPHDSVTFLGYPNQYLDQMWLPDHWLPSDPVRSNRTRTTRSPYKNSFSPGAIYCGQSLLHDVESLLLREKPDVVLTLHPNDVHVDHWPTYTFVEYALNELAAQGRGFARTCRVYSYLIHRDYWPAPRAYRPLQKLNPPSGLERTGETMWLGLPLSLSQTVRKNKAISLYRTQGGHYAPLLRSFARADELYGVMKVQTWSNGSPLPIRTVIKDPVADLVSSRGNAHGDITLVRLGKEGDFLGVMVTTRGTASTRITYHCSIHAGGRSPADRTIAEYQWRGTQASGVLLRDSSLNAISASAVTSTIRGKESDLHVPLPVSAARNSFFMLRVWTTRGSRLIDETETVLLRLPPPR